MPDFRKSKTKGKKYDVFYNERWIPFGSINDEHFKDTTGLGLYSNLNHNSEKRRKAFKARFRDLKSKDGKIARLDKNSPLYWSYNYLW